MTQLVGLEDKVELIKSDVVAEVVSVLEKAIKLLRSESKFMNAEIRMDEVRAAELKSFNDSEDLSVRIEKSVTSFGYPEVKVVVTITKRARGG